MQETKRFRKVLRDLDRTTVWVHEIDRTAAADGLSRQHLQDAVVIRLLDSGIKALGIGNVPEPPGNPWLNVFIYTSKFQDIYFYSVVVRLDETVRLERNQSIKTVGSTWETAQRGITTPSRMPAEIEKAVDYLLDYFIYDCMADKPH